MALEKNSLNKSDKLETNILRNLEIFQKNIFYIVLVFVGGNPIKCYDNIKVLCIIKWYT